MTAALCSNPKDKARCKERFLEVMSETASVKFASDAAGISRRGAYSWKNADPEFAAAWAEALAIGITSLEDECMRRAHLGTKRPVFYKGLQCGTIDEYSDTLAMFLLRAHRPEKYRERIALGGDPDAPPIKTENTDAKELARAVLFALRKGAEETPVAKPGDPT